MDNPLISVIMANYNTSIGYLKEAIDSVLSQTYSFFEFIIIDDASSNGSVSIIEDYDDNRIKLIVNEKNIGLTKSLNKALRLAQGKYVIRMDSDDISLPERFRNQVDYMEEHPDVIVCGTWFEKFGVENRVRKPIINDTEYYRCQLLFSNTPITMCHPSVIMRKSMLEYYHIQYDESVKKAQDYALWVECSKHGNMAILQKVLLRYRTHEKQISIDKKEEQNSYAERISRTQLSLLGIIYQEEEKRWRYDIVKTQKEYLSFYTWIEKIIKANHEKNVYDNQVLAEYLDNKLKNAIKRLGFREKAKTYLFTNKKSRSLFRGLVFHSILKRIGHEKA